MRNIAIIPARSGSKGLKDKNIKMLNGKPLISYTIEAALQSNLFDEVMVSTDSEKYAQIAMEYGASIPFLRSEELSSDSASSWDVVKEIINHYEEKGKKFDTITLLQPTSPLRNKKHIIEAFDMYYANKAKFIASVCEVDHSPLWTNSLPENLSLVNFINDEIYSKPRQLLDTFYRLNGAIYIVDKYHLLNEMNLYKKDSYAYIMSKKSSVDIDDELDFKIAEVLIKENNLY